MTRRIHLVSCLMLFAGLASGACLTMEDDGVLDGERASTAALSTETTVYNCMFPMCGGGALEVEFDSRDLQLRDCAYDKRANALVCDMRAADSPAMPAAFWDSRDVRLDCEDGLGLACTGSSKLQSCACTTTAAGETAPAKTVKKRQHRPVAFTTE